MIINPHRFGHTVAIISKNDMTSNSDGGYTASASSQYGTFYEYEAFNGSLDYDAGSIWLSNAEEPAWLQHQLPAAKVCTKYIIKGHDDSGQISRMCRDWTFKGSTNGSDWDTLDTQSSITFSASESKEFTISARSWYDYYRLDISANNGDSYIAVGELEIYGYGE